MTKLAHEASIAQTLALFFYKIVRAVFLKKQNSCSKKEVICVEFGGRGSLQRVTRTEPAERRTNAALPGL